MNRIPFFVSICFLLIVVSACTDNHATVKNRSIILSGHYEFKPEFTILYCEDDPDLAMEYVFRILGAHRMPPGIEFPDKQARLIKLNRSALR